jgi:hypothetical protein
MEVVDRLSLQTAARRCTAPGVEAEAQEEFSIQRRAMVEVRVRIEAPHSSKTERSHPSTVRVALSNKLLRVQCHMHHDTIPRLHCPLRAQSLRRPMNQVQKLHTVCREQIYHKVRPGIHQRVHGRIRCIQTDLEASAITDHHQRTCFTQPSLPLPPQAVNRQKSR